MEKTEEQKKTIRNEWGQFWIWIGALAAGAGLGLIGSGSIDKTASFIATIYTPSPGSAGRRAPGKSSVTQ